jgi:hypothetical protein
VENPSNGTLGGQEMGKGSSKKPVYLTSIVDEEENDIQDIFLTEKGLQLFNEILNADPEDNINVRYDLVRELGFEAALYLSWLSAEPDNQDLIDICFEGCGKDDAYEKLRGLIDAGYINADKNGSIKITTKGLQRVSIGEH